MLKIVRMPADEQVGHPAGRQKSVLDTGPDTAVVGAIETIGWVMRHHDQGFVGIGVFYFPVVPVLLRLGDKIIDIGKPDDRGYGRVQYPIVPGEVHGGSLPLRDDQFGLHKIVGKGRQTIRAERVVVARNRDDRISVAAIGLVKLLFVQGIGTAGVNDIAHVVAEAGRFGLAMAGCALGLHHFGHIESFVGAAVVMAIVAGVADTMERHDSTALDQSALCRVDDLVQVVMERLANGRGRYLSWRVRASLHGVGLIGVEAFAGKIVGARGIVWSGHCIEMGRK